MKDELTLKSLKDIKRKKVKMNFSEDFLKGLLSLMIKEGKFKTLKTLRNIQRLLGILDDKAYDHETIEYTRLEIISLTVDAILEHGISGNLLKSYVKENYSTPELVDEYYEEANNISLTEGEITYVLNTLSDRLAYSCVIALKDIMQDALDDLDDKGISYAEKMSVLYQISSAISLIQRETNTSITSNNMFSLRCDKFDEIMDSVMNELQHISKCYVTGIKRLNSILGGGYLSGRLYCYTAFPGGGKSMMLLQSAIDIKKYNHIEPDDPNKTPAILLLTMENSVTESVGRLFNMTVSGEEMSDMDPNTVKNLLREQGGMTIDEQGSNMDILIKYFKVDEISTTDIYTIIDDLENDGYEIKVLIVDYLKRIRCSNPRVMTEKDKLKTNTNDLKGIATDLKIPVITAHQLNRSSASVVDNALQSNKIDVTRLINRDGIGDAWEINENCDWICVLNRESDMESKPYLAFKLLKRRYKSLEQNVGYQAMNYFVHPLNPVNAIQLLPDVHSNKSLSLTTLGGNTVDVTVTNRGRSEFADKIKEAFSVVDFTNDEGLQM